MALSALAGAVGAESHGGEVKIGVLLGYTGPLESITPLMAAGAEIAMAGSERGWRDQGMTVTSVRRLDLR